MKTKKCYRCGITKAVDEFHKNKRRPDGISTACKPCAIDIRKTWTANNKDYVLRRDRAYYEKNAEHCKKRESSRKESSPERTVAHEAVRNEIRNGRMVPQPCFMCGKKAEAHHVCYDMPLAVTWLCRSHHRQTHTESV